jgi:Big-like domain-containing protein/centrosomal CEP192-like protein/HYDIN/CFA65/VesB family protein
MSTGEVTLTASSGSTTKNLPVSVTVGPPTTLQVSMSTAQFGSVPVGASGHGPVIYLENKGSTTAIFPAGSTVTDNSVFGIGGNNCAPALLPGKTCQIYLSFTPAQAGTVTGTLTITDNASGGTQTVQLTGTGGPGTAALSTPGLEFGESTPGTWGNFYELDLINNTPNPLTFSAPVATAGPFLENDDCLPSLGSGYTTCWITEEFDPVTLGPASGSVTVFDSGTSAPLTATLSGFGGTHAVMLYPPANQLRGYPPQGGVIFGYQNEGVPSVPQLVTLFNGTSNALSISNISTSASFAQSNNCGASLAVNASCIVQVVFTPSAIGAATGTLTVADSDPTSPQTISLSGTGIAVDDGSLAISPSSYDYGNTPTGFWSNWGGFTLTNNGSNPITIQNVSVSGPFWTYPQTCQGTWAPGASCTFPVIGQTGVLGKVNGEIMIADSDGNHFVPISITGVAQTASLSPASLNFGSQTPNTTSASQPVTLVNNTASTLVLTGIGVSSPFAQTNNCGNSLAAWGKNCTINVTFTPTAIGAVSGTLTVTDTNSSSQQTVALSGIGGAPGSFSLSATDATVSAGGTGTSTVTETITNGYNTPVTFSVSGLPAGVTASFSPASLTGAGTSTLTFTASSTVVSGSSTITGIGTPASGTAQTASLTLQVNASPSAIPTTTVLSITPGGGSLTVGSTYTLTATVTPSSGTVVPTGNVVFTIGSAPQTVALNSAGGATYTGTAPAATGNLSISAAYQGSAQFAVSDSNTLTETLTAIATTTTLTASPNPITQGGQVTLTATVTPASGAASPTGTVSFYNGATLIGTASLSGDSASLHISSLPAGTDLLTATYSGSATFSSSSSSAVSLVVNPTNPMPAIASASPAFTSAGSGTFTLTVNGSGFVAGSTAYWGASALTTQFVSATQLTAQIPAVDIADSGVSAITVETPTPGGGLSNTFQFEVDSADSGTAAPVFSSTSATVTASSTANYPVTLPASATGVSVICLNLPAGAVCSYSATDATLQVTTSSTTPAGTYQITAVFTESLPGITSALLVLPFILGSLPMARRKKAARSSWLIFCLAILVVAGVTMLIGCGGSPGSSSTGPTNPTHQVTSSGVVYLTVQ